MTELELAQSQIVALTTSNVLLRGELVALKEALARERRNAKSVSDEPDPDSEDDRTQAEIDREEKGEHDADCERDGH